MIAPYRHRPPVRRAAPLAALLALLAIASSLALLASCSTEVNPAFCCSDPEDCSRFGVTDEKRECASGLTCAGHTCVSVACQSAADCDPAAPVCDGNACRACRLDSECPSGACADDGTCVAEEGVVYLDPQGQDAPPCSRDRPCQDLRFGIKQTNGSRTHIVLAQGSYSTGGFPLQISSQSTTAVALSIHGGGSTLTGGSGDGFLNISLPTTLRDLELVNPTPSEGIVIGVGAATVLEHTKIRGFIGISNFGHVRLVDANIRAINRGIQNHGTLVIDQATIVGGAIGIESSSGTVDVTNLLVFGTSGIGLDFTSTGGSISFSTITDTGQGGTGTPGVRCFSAVLSIRSTIIWTPASPLRAGIEGGCTLLSSIAGPIGVVGATNADPLFVDPIGGDYHLSGGSPARDMVDTGPEADFEGDPRPRGLRFDIGADEAP